LYHDKEWKGIEQKYWEQSLHHFVQRLLVPYIRQQVTKQQVLMRAQQNCSKQDKDERHH